MAGENSLTDYRGQQFLGNRKLTVYHVEYLYSADIALCNYFTEHISMSCHLPHCESKSPYFKNAQV